MDQGDNEIASVNRSPLTDLSETKDDLSSRWMCWTCTYMNLPDMEKCIMCEASKPLTEVSR